MYYQIWLDNTVHTLLLLGTCLPVILGLALGGDVGISGLGLSNDDMLLLAICLGDSFRFDLFVAKVFTFLLPTASEMETIIDKLNYI